MKIKVALRHRLQQISVLCSHTYRETRTEMGSSATISVIYQNRNDCFDGYRLISHIIQMFGIVVIVATIIEQRVYCSATINHKCR